MMKWSQREEVFFFVCLFVADHRDLGEKNQFHHRSFHNFAHQKYRSFGFFWSNKSENVGQNQFLAVLHRSYEDVLSSEGVMAGGSCVCHYDLKNMKMNFNSLLIGKGFPNSMYLKSFSAFSQEHIFFLLFIYPTSLGAVLKQVACIIYFFLLLFNVHEKFNIFLSSLIPKYNCCCPTFGHR